MADLDLLDTIAQYYDLIYAHRNDDVKMWLILCEEALGKGEGGHILELGCGTGRLLIPLLSEGHRVTGIDLSPVALQSAQAKIEVGGFTEQATLEQADMRFLTLKQKDFAFAFIPSNTFMHCLTQTDQLATLQCVHKHLQAEGILMIDLFHPHPQLLLEADARLQLMHQSIDEITGNLVQQFCIRQVDYTEQIQAVTFILDGIKSDGQVYRQTIPFEMRYVHRFEMEFLLEQAGFDVIDIFGNYDLSPFDGDSPRMIFRTRA